MSELFNAHNIALAFGVLFGISESLAGIGSLKSNSVFQLVYNILKALAGQSNPPAETPKQL